MVCPLLPQGKGGNRGRLHCVLAHERQANPSDVLTKLLKEIQMKDFIVPIMHFKGDTLDYLPKGDEDTF